MDPTKWAQTNSGKNIVSKLLEVLPPVEDGVVFVAWRVARGAAPIKLQHWRRCEHDPHVWELLGRARALMGEDQRLRVQVPEKNLTPEMSLARTSKCIFHDMYMSSIGIASDIQVSEKNHYFSLGGVRLRHVHRTLLGGRPAPPEGSRVRYKHAPALVGLRPCSSISAGTTPPCSRSGPA